MSVILPPLRRKFFHQIVKIVFLFSCLSLILILLIHKSRSNPKVLFISCIILFIGFIITIYFTEKLSSTIALPLKKIAEVLQNKPKLSEKLKFPEAKSLEIKVLISEINALWNQLSQLNAINVRNLEAQKAEMEVIFSAMEDAAIFLDSQNRVQYFNQGFLDILGTKDENLIYEQKWDDLSILSPSYLQLRTLMRKESMEEVLFTCVIQEEDKIYRARKKIVADSKHKQLGVILLLHDITKKIPANTFRDTLAMLKMENNEV